MKTRILIITGIVSILFYYGCGTAKKTVKEENISNSSAVVTRPDDKKTDSGDMNTAGQGDEIKKEEQGDISAENEKIGEE